MTRWRTSGPSWTICAKCGIDATIPDDVPRARFQRIRYPHADELELDGYLGGAGDDEEFPDAKSAGETAGPAGAAARIRELLAARSMYFNEIADSVGEVDFQSVARAMGELHAAREIDQDSEGRYRLALVDSVHGLR